MSERVLVVRPDNAGDVLLMGPAVRAAAAAATVTLWCGPRGRPAAELLPGVSDVIVAQVPWIDADPDPVDRRATLDLVERIRRGRFDRAVVLTSFHQSPLPTALLLRLAGVPFVGAVSTDYPGSLLDVRHVVSDDIHEVSRSLSLMEACGYALPPGDDGGLRVKGLSPYPLPPDFEDYIVVHPGASVPARRPAPELSRTLVGALTRSGRRVVVTGSQAERPLTSFVAGEQRDTVIDTGGKTGLGSLAAILSNAGVVVVGNTCPAHLAAAVGTPVVSIYAPTVPAVRWRPWLVTNELLGNQEISCAGCRARICPVAGHPCITSVSVDDVLAAIARVERSDRSRRPVEVAR
jgi:ADP-heptose:LPS heptosyltransferase